MIRLGKLTDYAVVVMAQLAREERESACSAQYLSARTGLPAPTVAKVLKKLAGGGLAVSVRGAAGGYRLARAAEGISVADVVAVMDGPVALSACVPGGGGCDTGACCPVRGNWDRVNRAVAQALESVSVAEMGRPARATVRLPGGSAHGAV